MTAGAQARAFPCIYALRGFINDDFAALYPDFIREVGPHVKSGRIKYEEDIVDAFEHTVSAFLGMFEGRNFGKLRIRVAN